jgi:hypothetical protein
MQTGAADEQLRVDIGDIDQMLARRQGFLHESLLDSRCAPRFMDSSRGCVHVRE